MFSESMSGFGYMYLPFERSVELTDEGFRVEREHGGEVLFIFHYSSLEMEGFKTIDVDAVVEFELEETSKGKRATHIKVVTK